MRLRVTPQILMLLLVAHAACAQCETDPLVDPVMASIMNMLQTMGWPIGLFMMIYMGIKWITAEGPQDRENARRGIIYVVIGLLLLATGVRLVYYLLCF